MSVLKSVSVSRKYSLFCNQCIVLIGESKSTLLFNFVSYCVIATGSERHMCNLPAFMVYFFNVFLEKSELFNPIYLFSMSSGGLLK